MTVSGVEDGTGELVGGRGVGVRLSVGVRLGVPVGRGVEVGGGVDVGLGVRDGVEVGGSTAVAVISASSGYSCSIAEYQSSPSGIANSLKRAPG